MCVYACVYLCVCVVIIKNGKIIRLKEWEDKKGISSMFLQKAVI